MGLNERGTRDDFLAFIHLHAVEYQFGAHKMIRDGDNLWFVQHKTGARMDSAGGFHMPPAKHEDRVDWIRNTQHDFETCYKVLADWVDPSMISMPAFA